MTATAKRQQAYEGPASITIRWADGREDTLAFGQPSRTAEKKQPDGRTVGGNLNSYAGGTIPLPAGVPADHKAKVSCNVTMVAPR